MSILLLLTLGFYPDSASVVYRSGYDVMIPFWGATPVVRDSRGGLHVVFALNYALPFGESTGVYYSRSSDDGATWTPIENASRTDSLVAGPAALAIDAGDQLHCVWLQFFIDSSHGRYWDFAYMRRDSSGWSRPVNISRLYAVSNFSAPCAIATDPSGRVHVVFAGNHATFPDIYHCYLAGDSWTTPQPLTTSRFDDGGPSLVCDRRGRLHLTWSLHQWAVTDDTIYYATWDSVWSRPEPLAALNSNCGVSAIAVDTRDEPVAVYGAGDYARAEVYFAHRDSTGWVSERLSGPYAGAHQPTLALDTNDNAYAAWEEAGDVMLRCFNGSGWTPARNLTDDSLSAGQPHLIARPGTGRVDLVWWSSYAVVPEELVYMGLLPLVSAVGHEPTRSRAAAVSLLASPCPASGPVTFRVALPGSSNWRLSIFDLAGGRRRSWSGCLPVSQIVWDRCDEAGTRLPAGIYAARIDCRGQAATTLLVLR